MPLPRTPVSLTTDARTRNLTCCIKERQGLRQDAREELLAQTAEATLQNTGFETQQQRMHQIKRRDDGEHGQPEVVDLRDVAAAQAVSTALYNNQGMAISDAATPTAQRRKNRR